MLDAMEPVTATRPIDTVVNTHANGDHCYGNGLLEGAEIVTTEAAAREMGAVPPSALVALLQADLDPVTAEYIQEAFGGFEFKGITIPEPTQTFSGRLELKLGDHPVHLEQVGPAHTAGDLIVHLPDESTVFTGDILFVNGTPIVWDGPIANWVAACDRILELGCDVIVPGHGPLTDAGGVLAVRDYLTWLEDACRSRHKEGLIAADTISDLATSEEFAPYREWGEWERLAVNVRAAYREIDGDDRTIPSSFVEMATEMAMLAAGG
tara:strand:+ start:359 stop:1156 length:798 start_codon:yes stop_codon:yes gene_type:complete